MRSWILGIIVGCIVGLIPLVAFAGQMHKIEVGSTHRSIEGGHHQVSVIKRQMTVDLRRLAEGQREGSMHIVHTLHNHASGNVLVPLNWDPDTKTNFTVTLDGKALDVLKSPKSLESSASLSTEVILGPGKHALVVSYEFPLRARHLHYLKLYSFYYSFNNNQTGWRNTGPWDIDVKIPEGWESSDFNGQPLQGHYKSTPEDISLSLTPPQDIAGQLIYWVLGLAAALTLGLLIYFVKRVYKRALLGQPKSISNYILPAVGLPFLSIFMILVLDFGLGLLFFSGPHYSMNLFIVFMLLVFAAPSLWLCLFVLTIISTEIASRLGARTARLSTPAGGPSAHQ